MAVAYHRVNAGERLKCRTVARVCQDDAFSGPFQGDDIASPLARSSVSWPPHPSRLLVSCLIVGCMVAMSMLLLLGRLAVRQWPVELELVGGGPVLIVTVEGVSQRVDLTVPLVAVRPAVPVAYRREHQIDGSDSTNMFTFSSRYFSEFGASPYYQFQAWLRDEQRYSRWTGLELMDGAGRVLARQDDPPDEINIPVPTEFRLRINLERPEIPRYLELIDAEERLLFLEVNRNDKYVRVGRQRNQDQSDLARWYFPRGVATPLATLFDLFTRSLALALGLVLVVGVVAALAPAPGCLRWLPGSRTLAVGTALGSVWLLAASWYVATALFERAPHILDAISYLFQAKTFAGGAFWAPPPLVNDAFTIPFATVYQERWFSQYPPGTAATLMLGVLAGAPWLVQPVLAVGAVILATLAVRRQYGPGTALLVLALLVTSPFLLLNAGSFLSHVPALLFAMVAMYAVTRYADRPSARWAALTGLGLALTLLTREMVPILYGATLILTGIVQAAPKRGRTVLLDMLIVGLVFAGGALTYLAFNAAVTGSPWLLPRLAVNGADRWGFGTGIGFYGEHTIASGLVNTEEQLVSLGFTLTGWPFGFALALMALPFLLRRANRWDLAHGSLVGFYVVAYAAYFYHGIAFGPRYYFEALPSMLILIVRGLGALTDTLTSWLLAFGYPQPWWRARQASGLLLAALLTCNLVYFLPRQATLYAGFTGLPGGGPVLDQQIGLEFSGRVSRLENALVVIDEWWLYMAYFAAMNCPRLDCPTIFAHAGDDETREVLRRMYPDRRWYTAVDRRGTLTIEPAAP